MLSKLSRGLLKGRAALSLAFDKVKDFFFPDYFFLRDELQNTSFSSKFRRFSEVGLLLTTYLVGIGNFLLLGLMNSAIYHNTINFEVNQAGYVVLDTPPAIGSVSLLYDGSVFKITNVALVSNNTGYWFNIVDGTLLYPFNISLYFTSCIGIFITLMYLFKTYRLGMFSFKNELKLSKNHRFHFFAIFILTLWNIALLLFPYL